MHSGMPALPSMRVCLYLKTNKSPTALTLPFSPGTKHSDRWRSPPMLPDDSEHHISPYPLPPWHSPPGSGRPHADVPPYSHSGPQPPPWSFPSPTQSWDDLRGRHMRAEPYSPPRRFNMGFTPRKHQSADHTGDVRPHCWSSPRDRTNSPTRRMPSPRSYFPGLGGQMSSPNMDSLASPSNSMPRPRGGTLRCRVSRWDRSLSPRDRSLSPRDCSLSPRDRSLSPRDRSLSPRDRSLSPRDPSLRPRDRFLSPRDCSSNPRDSSPSPLSSACDHITDCCQDSAHTSTQEDDCLHMARAAVISPMGALPGPQPDIPAYAHSDLPGQSSPHGQHHSCLSGSYRPATTSPAVASCLLPSPLADGPLQGCQSVVQDAQKPSQRAAAVPQAEQVELQPHSPVAKRRLDMSTADTAAQETVAADSSNIDSDSTTAPCQTDLKGSFTLPDLHAVVSDPSETPLTQMHDGTGAAAIRRQRPKQGDRSLLEKVLRKSLAKQDVKSKGLSGSEAEQASCNSSQFVFQPCSESAKAPDAQRPQHAKPREQADVRKSRKAKGPQPAEPRGDSKEQAHEQTSFHDDRAKRKSKRSRQSSGGHSCSESGHIPLIPSHGGVFEPVSGLADSNSWSPCCMQRTCFISLHTRFAKQLPFTDRTLPSFGNCQQEHKWSLRAYLSQST